MLRRKKKLIQLVLYFFIIKFLEKVDNCVFSGIIKVVERAADLYEVELREEHSGLIGDIFIAFHFNVIGSSLS